MMKDDPTKWRDLSCSLIRRLNIAKIAIFPKLFKFDTISSIREMQTQTNAYGMGGLYGWLIKSSVTTVEEDVKKCVLSFHTLLMGM